nr:copia protein [Tanacetum cinerariifolium]
MKVEESLNVTFDEILPPTKLSSLVDDDVGEEEEAIKKNTKVVNNNSEEDESIEVNEIVNIKETKNHPLDQVIGNLNQKTLRINIMFSVCLCARFQENPKTAHLEAIKRIFRYIRGTSHLGLWYPKGTIIETIIYADSDHAEDYVDHKSTSGVCTFMGCCLTSWFAKKQRALAIFTTEAEYVSAGKACQHALWMKQALIDYGIRLNDVPVMCDNKSAIYLSIKMPSEYQQDYKKTRADAPKIYNDPNMSNALKDIYRTLGIIYFHEGGTTNPSIYNDLSDDSMAKFTTIGNRDHTQAVIALMLYFLETGQPFNLAYFSIRRMYFFRDRKDKVLPYGMILTRLFKNLKANMVEHLFDECYKLIPRKMSSLKAKQPKKPPPKRTRNVGKSKCAQLSTSSSIESPPSDNEDLPSTKLSHRELVDIVKITLKLATWGVEYGEEELLVVWLVVKAVLGSNGGGGGLVVAKMIGSSGSGRWT